MLTIVDLHQQQELSSSDMSQVIGALGLVDALVAGAANGILSGGTVSESPKSPAESISFPFGGLEVRYSQQRPT